MSKAENGEIHCDVNKTNLLAEIAGEFYPDGNAAAAEESTEPSIGQGEWIEQLARICELARRLGLSDAKTKMLIGQSAGDLAGLEQKLLKQIASARLFLKSNCALEVFQGIGQEN